MLQSGRRTNPYIIKRSCEREWPRKWQRSSHRSSTIATTSFFSRTADGGHVRYGMLYCRRAVFCLFSIPIIIWHMIASPISERKCCFRETYVQFVVHLHDRLRSFRTILWMDLRNEDSVLSYARRVVEFRSVMCTRHPRIKEREFLLLELAAASCNFSRGGSRTPSEIASEDTVGTVSKQFVMQ